MVIAEKMMKWGQTNCDNFPWRNPGSPYESAIAEIMLIRTPPEQVLPVYQKFLNCYPQIGDLYESLESDIIDVIESLGLAWRAKRLRCLADYIMEELKGTFPETKEELEDIPGIGPYAAATISIMYYNKRAIMVDSNTVRFFERYLGRVYRSEARRDKRIFEDMDRLTPEDNSKVKVFACSFIDFMRNICSPAPSGLFCENCIIRPSCHYALEDKE